MVLQFIACALSAEGLNACQIFLSSMAILDKRGPKLVTSRLTPAKLLPETVMLRRWALSLRPPAGISALTVASSPEVRGSSREGFDSRRQLCCGAEEGQVYHQLSMFLCRHSGHVSSIRVYSMLLASSRRCTTGMHWCSVCHTCYSPGS